MNKLFLGIVSLLLSLSSFASSDSNGVQEALKRRALFIEATTPTDSDLNLGEYLNCIYYDLRTGEKRITLASKYWVKESSNIYSDHGIGDSVFSSATFELSGNALAAKVFTGDVSHINTIRATSDGKLLVEIATNSIQRSINELPESGIHKGYKGILYGACELKYGLDVANINKYKILDI